MDGRTERRPQTIALLVIASLGTEVERRAVAKSEVECGASAKDAAKTAGIPPFLARDVMADLNRVRLATLHRQLGLIHDADLALKTSQQEPHALVENLIIELHRAAGRAVR
jgi:DNA polymerase III delta subunit